MAFFKKRSRAVESADGPARLPASMAVETKRGESVLAAAQDDLTQAWVALTTYRLVVLTAEGDLLLERPWHEVDTGAWSPDASTLSVSFIGGATALQWRLKTSTGPGRTPQVFRERVSASVVQVREVKMGPRRSARVSVRAVLSSGDLIDQVVFGRGVQAGDSELNAEVERVRQEVRASVGLPPHDTAESTR